jgi:hypothetical protein
VRPLVQKLGWPPTRQQATWGVIVIAVIVGVTGFVTSGVIAGLSLFLGFPGVLSLILLFLPSRPKVSATLRGEENAITCDMEIGLIISTEQTVRPLDIDQIVKAEEHAALETMPRAPTPKVPPGSALAPLFNLNQSTANMLSAVSGASDEELEKFMRKVRRYGEELRAWLEELQASRAERLRAFSATARAREEGQAPADFARMRLRFPEEFEEAERPPIVPEPPSRPEYVAPLAGRVTWPRAPVQQVARGALSRLLNRSVEHRVQYSNEDGMTVISLEVGHVNQSDHRDTAEFALRAAPPGVYDIEWQISADGLNPPTKGKIKVEVREPISGEPIVELAEALAERERYSLD